MLSLLVRLREMSFAAIALFVAVRTVNALLLRHADEMRGCRSR